jgi:hypothetical protein
VHLFAGQAVFREPMLIRISVVQQLTHILFLFFWVTG